MRPQRTGEGRYPDDARGGPRPWRRRPCIGRDQCWLILRRHANETLLRTVMVRRGRRSREIRRTGRERGARRPRASRGGLQFGQCSLELELTLEHLLGRVPVGLFLFVVEPRQRRPAEALTSHADAADSLPGNMIRTRPRNRHEHAGGCRRAVSSIPCAWSDDALILRSKLVGDAMCPGRPRRAERQFLVAKRDQAVQ